jgi:type I restriction enzyme S subunit
VSIEDIKDGWNLDIANPNKLDAEHRDPAEVLKECDALLGEVDATRTSLRDSLADVVDDGYAQTNRETFLNSFGYITDAPDGIDKLRRLIRDLAVRGRLTRRDPDDEPVADLLTRIRDERDRRAATKGVRKQQQVPDLPAADRPFVLPSAWAWVRFGNICQSRLGKMLDEEKNSGTPRKYLRNANVQWDRFDLTEVKELRLEDGELGEYELLDGDLLVVEGGYPGRCAVWDSNLADGVMVFQKALHRVRPEVGISSRFIALVLRNAVDTGRILEFFTGSGIKHLTGKKLVAVPVPLPPIGEQRRIVERVAELYEICDLLEQQLCGAESLRADLASSIAAHAIGSDTR